MADDFMVCIDRIITSACFESINEREKLLRNVVDEVGIAKMCLFLKNSEVGFLKISEKNGGEGCYSKMVRECRICQEDDEEHDMEAPCAYNGTLKFAHRKCIQRWCNKKGDITCEICNQASMGPTKDLRDPRFLAFTAAERQFLQSEYEDYAVASSGSIMYFQSVAIVTVDAHLAYTPNSDGKRLQDGAGIIDILQSRFPYFSLLVFVFHAMRWPNPCTLSKAKGGGWGERIFDA